MSQSTLTTYTTKINSQLPKLKWVMNLFLKTQNLSKDSILTLELKKTTN
jgi:hypothetical protein